MERRIKEFIQNEPQYIQPYANHFGYGHTVGCGDDTGCGRAFIDVLSAEDNDYSGKGILSFNNQPTYMIDDYLVYITHIHNPWVKGEIINNDFSTQSCYMIKINNKYVVANSIRNALEGMREKIFTTANNDFDIAQAFVIAHPDYEKEYDWEEMVSWHTLKPSSCAEGRRNFSKYSKMGPGKTATPKELINFMRKSSSRPLAEKMEQLYLNKF